MATPRAQPDGVGQHRDATRSDDSHDLVSRLVEVPDVLEEVAREGNVHRVIGKWRLLDETDD